VTRLWLLAAFGALGAACGDTTTIGASELNLDRPVDVSFACYGQMRQTSGLAPGVPTDPIITTAMPTAACEALSPAVTNQDLTTGAAIPPSPVLGQETLSGVPNNPTPTWYAFILQSASGTVALATWPVKPGDSIANPALGAVGDFNVLDADPSTPGKNAISIGEDPVAIVTDKTGCFEVTANAGSCDLSELNITSALDIVVGGSSKRLAVDRVQVTLPVALPSGKPIPLLSRPAAMIVEPGIQTVGNACPATATGQVYLAYPGCHLVAEVQLGADPATGSATAQVIGGIQFDPTTGAPIVLDAAGLAGLSNCPTECVLGQGTTSVAVTHPLPPGVRPVALDYKLDPRIDTGINARKLEVTSRLAIGADISAMIAIPTAAPLTIVDLDLTTFAPVAAKLHTISLEPTVQSPGLPPHPVSVTALTLSPQIGMTGNAQDNTVFPPIPVDDQTQDQAQYVYAVATDGTVRVADVLNLNQECDTQIDGRFLTTVLPPELDCLQPGQANRPRRSGARGPGIELPGGAVATSVAILKGRTLPPLVIDTNTNRVTGIQTPDPGTLVGYFAIITASSGTVYVANVDDDDVPDEFFLNRSISTSPVLVMAHQLRDSFTFRDDQPAQESTTNPTPCTAVDGPQGAFAGGPRLSTPPVQQAATSTLSAGLNAQLPRPQQVECDEDPAVPITALEFGAPRSGIASPVAPPVSRDTVYPELASVMSENWTLTYEGTLQLDNTVNSINGPSLRFGQAFVDRTGMFFEDPARPFCDMGIEPWDIVELRGCNPANGDGDCPADYTCYVHPLSTIGVGACFLKSDAPRLADACQDFLSSTRRYTVGTDPNGRTEAGKLVLLQRKHELSTTPIDGCVSDDQCDDLARAALVINQSADPFIEAPAGTPAPQGPTHWSCLADPLRKPINADPARNKRCVQVCTFTPRTSQSQNTNAQAPFCASGAVCVPDDPTATGPTPGVCMEGVEPPQACLNGPQRYFVRAGEAFTVIGDHSGFVHPIVADTDGSCMVDPNLAKDPLARGRIPLIAPPCDPSANVLTGQDGVTNAFEANPCSLTVPQFEPEIDYPAAPPPDPDPSKPVPYGSCLPTTQTVTPAPTTTRQAVPAIKFRNRALTLTIVDPYRPAAQSCLGRDPIDPQTKLPIPANVPFVVPGYAITLPVKGGFSPFTLSLIGQVSPVKVVRGPSESIWVVDDGDFLGATTLDVSTRGRVFRVETGDTTIVNLLE
jgi:hypothetical protein